MIKNSSVKNASMLFAFFLFTHCGSSKSDANEQSVSSGSTEGIVVDTVYCNVDLFSQEGFFRIIQGKVAYIQSSLENVLWFDPVGSHLGITLGSGYGPGESNGDLAYHGFHPDGRNLFLGSNYIFKAFNDSLSKIDGKVSFTWTDRKTKYNTLDLSDPSMYDYHYRDEPYIDSQWLPVINNMAVIPLNINPYINTSANLTDRPENFFGNANTIGLVDLETGVLESVFRKHSSPFEENQWLYFYNYPYRETDDEFIYVSDRLGPQIEVYDPVTLRLVDSFGEKGKYFNEGLDTYQSYEDFLSALSIEITLKYSYYTHIYMDESTGFLFRSYHIKDLNQWGLQVYSKDRKLIIDTLVPFRFNVVGKIGDYYYADGIRDEENNELAIYRFKLPL